MGLAFWCRYIIIVFVIPGMAKGSTRVPVGGYHLLHLAKPPKDLHDPIIVDAFPFWGVGFSTSYKLQPKYLDFYEIGLLSLDEGLASKEKFTGVVKVEFMWQGNPVCEYEINSIQGGVYAGKDMARFKTAMLLRFEIPIEGKFDKELSMRMTVVKADQNLQKYGDSLKIYVAVSATP